MMNNKNRDSAKPVLEVKKGKRCGECGSIETSPQDAYGPFPWRDYKKVLLARPVTLMTCLDCGNVMLYGKTKDAERLDQAIEESITIQVQQFIDQVLKREKCRQIDLAARLGITPEYVSAIKIGAKIPGFQTFNFLRILAQDENAFRFADPEKPTEPHRESA